MRRAVVVSAAAGLVLAAVAGGCGDGSSDASSSTTGAPATTAMSPTTTGGTPATTVAGASSSSGSSSLDCSQAEQLWTGVEDGAAHSGAAVAEANGVDAAVVTAMQTMATDAQQLVAMLPDAPSAAATWLQANQQFAAQAASLEQQHGSLDQFNAMMGQVGDTAYNQSVSQLRAYLVSVCPGQSF